MAPADSRPPCVLFTVQLSLIPPTLSLSPIPVYDAASFRFLFLAKGLLQAPRTSRVRRAITRNPYVG